LTSHGRVILTSVLDLPEIPRGVNVDQSKLDTNTQGIPKLDKLAISGLSGGMPLQQLVSGLEPAETVVTILPLEFDEKKVDQMAPFAVGTAAGVVKRIKPEIPPHDRGGNTHDAWQAINLEEGDSVIGGAPAPDDAEIVFIANDSSLLHFPASKVRPQGLNAGGMAGIALKDGARVIFFTALSKAVLEADPEPLVLTAAGDDNALAIAQNGFAKLTPFLLYPPKGRGTGGVRSQKFLKGQNALIFAWAGRGDARANTSTGTPEDLPEIDPRRDGSGKLLDAPITCVG
jgi:DNA gyrase subunit A